MRSLLLICLLCLAGVATAEEVADPPGRVARLSYTEGEVSLAPAGTEEWAEAVLNRPLTNGDRVWVDKGGRAELQVGSATVHLDENTGVSIVDLDDDVLHLDVTEGSANIRLLRRSDSERIEIDTPNSVVEVLHPGEYRIEVSGAGDQTIVRTRNGGAEVNAGSKTWRVDTSEEGVFDGVNEISARIEPLGPRTAFEDWANDRNRISENPVSTRYVSNEVVGYEDLDRHGYWVNEPSYGYVWQPTYVVSGWAPYRYGRWVWVSPWGWSWVDNSPWGFAPFHYGRWAYVRHRWCWVPGPRHIRPVYAPALVAWAGSPGVSVSVGFGSGVGWFPLGPREVYVPGYRYSRRYFNNVNVSNTVIVNNTYINNFYNGRPRNFDYMYGRDGRAVTIVDRDRFMGGRPIDNHWTRVDQSDLRRWHHDSRPPAIAPNRDSVFASRTLGRIPDRPNQTARDLVAQRPRGGLNQRIPFEAEQRAIEANGGRPIGRSQLMTGNTNPPPKDATRSHDQHEPERGQDNWRSRGGPDRSPAVTSERTPAAAASSRAVRERSVSDRPSWVQDRQRDRSAPPVNSLQQRSNAGGDGSGGSPRPDRGTQQPSWRGNAEQRLQRGPDEESIRPQNRPESRPENRSERVPDARDVFRDQAARQREERAQRNWSSQPQSRPERVEQQPRFEQPRSQPRVEQPRVEQPRIEQPRSQPRSEQPRFERSNSQPAARPQTSRPNNNQGNSNRSGESSRSQSGNRDRPNFRPQ
jgi:hypothetical protein